MILSKKKKEAGEENRNPTGFERKEGKKASERRKEEGKKTQT